MTPLRQTFPLSNFPSTDPTLPLGYKSPLIFVVFNLSLPHLKTPWESPSIPGTLLFLRSVWVTLSSSMLGRVQADPQKWVSLQAQQSEHTCLPITDNAGSITGWGEIPWRRKWQYTPSIFAWKIPWTGKTGRLQPMGSRRVGHDLAINHNPHKYPARRVLQCTGLKSLRLTEAAKFKPRKL